MLNAFAVTECINNYRIKQQFQQSHKNINHKGKKNQVEIRQLNSISWPIKMRKSEKRKSQNMEGLCDVPGTVMTKHWDNNFV